MNRHRTTQFLLAMVTALLLALPAAAQYGGGGSMGSGSSTRGYTPPKGGYSSSTGIGIAAGAAAAITVTYLVVRSRHTVAGCLQSAASGVELLNEKDHKTYSLVDSNLQLKPGDRVALRGKKSKDGSGGLVFHPVKLVKDYGACRG